MKMLFASGLPRTGSTLLMNVMNQNPLFQTTPTNGLVNSILSERERWAGDTNYRAQDALEIQESVKNMLTGMLTGFHKNTIDNGQIPIDKNRMWVYHIELLETLLNEDVKILMPIRNVNSVLASFEKVFRKSTLKVSTVGGESNSMTLEGRCENLLSDKSPLTGAVDGFREAIRRNLKDRLIIIPFNFFTHYPKETMDYIHERLGIEPYEYDFDNIVQTTFENDIIHGYQGHVLHTIQNSIKPISDFARKIECEYIVTNKSVDDQGLFYECTEVEDDTQKRIIRPEMIDNLNLEIDENVNLYKFIEPSYVKYVPKNIMEEVNNTYQDINELSTYDIYKANRVDLSF